MRFFEGCIWSGLQSKRHMNGLVYLLHNRIIEASNLSF